MSGDFSGEISLENSPDFSCQNLMWNDLKKISHEKSGEKSDEFSQISQVNKDEIRSPSARRRVHRESERKRERERSVVGEGIAVDSSAATADSRHRQPQPIGDQPATAPRSYVAGTTVSTSDATAEFREFQRSRSSPSIRLDRGVCRVHIVKSSDFNIWKKRKHHKVFFRLVHYLKLFAVHYLYCLIIIKKVKGIEVLKGIG